MTEEKRYPFEPDYAVAPGETLREVIESLGMTQKDLATRTGLTVQSINRIFKGDQPITHETANSLELVTGVPARFWNNLEAQYREQLTKLEERKRLETEGIEWLNSIPTSELIERGFIEPQTDDVGLLRETLKFYGVVSVEAWKDVWEKPAIAARRSACFESQPGPTSAWLRIGELKAHAIECDPFDKASFKEALKAIRSLTRESPEVFIPEMKRLCAESGVAVVPVPEMKKAPFNGATKWLSANKAMILLTLRGKGEDKFWFSFFHEAGHVLNDNKKNLYIADNSEAPEEQEADRFAAEFLIPGRYDDTIRSLRSEASFIEVADELNIAPGIVVGRYQHLTNNWKYLRKLIRSFRWNVQPSR
ncbi:helix-turn-helix domain-containing protein [bacterium]|nr:helix-turn-helix domain-containing protein [bacterium]